MYRNESQQGNSIDHKITRKKPLCALSTPPHWRKTRRVSSISAAGKPLRPSNMAGQTVIQGYVVRIRDAQWREERVLALEFELIIA